MAEFMEHQGQRPSAWVEAGRWAIDRVSQMLGEGWPERVWEEHSDLPSGIAIASWHTVAYAELLELALRLQLLNDCPRFVPLRRALKTDAREEQVQHLRIQLEVAALALRDGYPVEFEPPIPGSEKRADLAVNLNGAEPLIVETRAVLPDSDMRTVNEFTDELFPKISWVTTPHGVQCSGTVSEVLDEHDSAELLDEIKVRARLVAADMVAPPLRIHGAELTVSRAGEGTGLRGPQIGGNGWPRIAARLKEKAEQTMGAREVWLRFDVRQGIWQFTPWSQEDLVTKGEQLAAVVIETLSTYGHVDGVVMSSGSLLAQGQFDAEEHASAWGVVGLRRLIDPLRVREAFVIPLRDTATSQQAVEVWREFYGAEPTWLDWALNEFGLPSTACQGRLKTHPPAPVEYSPTPWPSERLRERPRLRSGAVGEAEQAGRALSHGAAASPGPCREA